MTTKNERDVNKMRPIRTVIADIDDEYRQRLRQCMGEFGVSCVGETSDGSSALEIILSEKPDVVITDLILSHKDGITLLQDAKRLMGESCPIFFIVASACTKQMVEDAFECGALYILMKPIPERIICTRALKLAGKQTGHNQGGFRRNMNITEDTFEMKGYDNIENAESDITEIICKFGIPASFKGYNYLCRAIVLFVKGGVSSNFSTDVYTKIASYFVATTSGVERAISHSLEYAWNREKTEGFMRLCEKYHLSPYKRPKNREFISSVADTLIQGMKYRR